MELARQRAVIHQQLVELPLDLLVAGVGIGREPLRDEPLDDGNVAGLTELAEHDANRPAFAPPSVRPAVELRALVADDAAGSSTLFAHGTLLQRLDLPCRGVESGERAGGGALSEPSVETR